MFKRHQQPAPVPATLAKRRAPFVLVEVCDGQGTSHAILQDTIERLSDGSSRFPSALREAIMACVFDGPEFTLRLANDPSMAYRVTVVR